MFENYPDHGLSEQIDLVFIILALGSRQVGSPNYNAWESV